MEVDINYFSGVNILSIIIAIFAVIVAIYSMVQMGKAYHVGLTLVFLLLFGGLALFLVPVALPVLTSYLIDFNRGKGNLSVAEFSSITEFLNQTLKFANINLKDVDTVAVLKYASIIVSFTYSTGLYLISGIYQKLNKWILFVIWLVAYQFFIFVVLIIALIFTILLPFILTFGLAGGVFVGIKAASKNYYNAIKSNYARSI